MTMGKSGKDDDTDLWARVTASATPLKKDRPARPAAPAKPPAPPKTKTSSGKAAPAVSKPVVRPAPKPVPKTGALDRQAARQLDSGKLAVEARLDLHGMKQREAHAALRRFLKSAQAKGKRHVLVITGKGADRSASRSFYEEEERGVLRQAVPHWLAAPDLAPLVVSFAEAPRRLGGEGALYVRLRRPR
ncbi:MAG: DNA mismatch repair protein MutS [Alphaproteobacteria bacterium]|nr:DNA mismatch repair protein MutS [Alphaproteobacteria bacterium]